MRKWGEALPLLLLLPPPVQFSQVIFLFFFGIENYPMHCLGRPRGMPFADGKSIGLKDCPVTKHVFHSHNARGADGLPKMCPKELSRPQVSPDG